MAIDNDLQTKMLAEGDTHTSEAYSAKLARYHTVCLIGYSLSFIIIGSQVSILGPTIKPLSERLGVDETDLSPLFTALGVSCIISGTPSGWFVDRFPTHHVLKASLLIEVGSVGSMRWNTCFKEEHAEA
jgi:MFS family permease